ncbi:MAG: glycosyltransferase family 39 protein [Bacteroidota bacterium]|nr:glycosyltransferase family 39 protein [Bacteroidota bacterium]
MKYFTKKNIIIFILLLATYFSIFFQLDSYGLQLWDEGTYAVNAYEMCLNGDLLVKHYNGAPEMWATNPPLVCYFQAICIKIFGPNEFAVRLPSALAALGVVLLIIRFSIKEKLGLDFMAYAVLGLISTKGYVGFHVTRTADLDSVLIFFVTGSIIYFYKFIEYEDKKTKYLIIFSIFVLLGYYAKGIACFMVLPAFLIYGILKNKVVYVLKNKYFYLCIISVLVLIAGYYLLREQRNPGYIKATFTSEVGRYYTAGNDWSTKPFYDYVQQMYQGDYQFILFIPAIIILFGFLPKSNIYKSKSIIWLTTSITYLLVISLSKNKTPWYDAPLYPMLSIYLALGLKSIIDYKKFTVKLSYLAKGAFCFGLFALPYSAVLEHNLKGEPGWHDTQFGDALHQYNELKNVPKKFEMLTAGYNGPALFYKHVYNNKFGYNITIRDISNKDINMQPGITYLFTHPAVREYMDKNFNIKVYLCSDGMIVATILSHK